MRYRSPMETFGSVDRLSRLAPRATWAAIGTLVASTASLALFFAGAGGVFGPINDLLLAATFVLLVPAVLAVGHLPGAPSWLRRLGAFALGGMAILVVGNILLVAGLVPLPVSFGTVSIGIVALLVWGAGAGHLALQGRILERGVGRWIVATGITFVLAAAAWPVLPIGAWSILGTLLFGTFLGWLVSLARALDRSRRPPEPIG